MRIIRYAYPTYRSPALATRGFSRAPWSGLESEIGRLFETALSDFAGATSTGGKFPVDIYEDKDNTFVRAELPGVNREAINVEVADGYLTITATRKTAPRSVNAESDKTDAKTESAAATGEQSFSFSRSVSLSDEVQTDKVSASYENGVLTVTLPKREEAKPKKISVAVK
jgi:HSP20 family protein